MTFRELKEFVNALNETQLNANVTVHDEESGMCVYGADVSQDNFYYNKFDSDDMFFEKDFREALAEDDEMDEDDFVCIPKGHPRLWNFA